MTGHIASVLERCPTERHGVKGMLTGRSSLALFLLAYDSLLYWGTQMTPSRCVAWWLLDTARNAPQIELPSNPRDLAAAACSSGEDQYSTAQSNPGMRSNVTSTCSRISLPQPPPKVGDLFWPSQSLINNVSYPLAPILWTCACIYRVQCRDCYQGLSPHCRPGIFLPDFIACRYCISLPLVDNYTVDRCHPLLQPCSLPQSPLHWRGQLHHSRTPGLHHAHQQRRQDCGMSTRGKL